MHAEPISLDAGPLDVVARWPRDTPLAALISEARPTTDDTATDPSSADRWSRWSLLFPIEAARFRAIDPAEVLAMPGTDDRLRLVERTLRESFGGPSAARQTSPSGLPQAPFRLIGLAYELGRVLEPSNDPRSRTPKGRATRMRPDTPLAFQIDAPAAIAFDRVAQRWWIVGETSSDADTLRPLLDSIRDNRPRADAGFLLGPLRSSTGRETYTASVAQALELIRAGDVFQVNLSHELRADLRGDRRAFFRRLCEAARPWFGAYIELPRPWATVASISPELFLEFDAASRRVTTRPIKGTRRSVQDHDHASAVDLRHSVKDAAELNMIIDLLRNDLGRVCAYGSVRVEEARAIESHAVLHAVATVSGRLRDDRTPADLMLAAFPGGSITGAPKVRAMQVIEQLESTPRGIYCGSIALRTGDGSFTSSVAIRTATISTSKTVGASGGEFDLSFPVGAGIVADSDPAGEWQETLDKASALQSLVMPDGECKDKVTVTVRLDGAPANVAHA